MRGNNGTWRRKISLKTKNLFAGLSCIKAVHCGQIVSRPCKENQTRKITCAYILGLQIYCYRWISVITAFSSLRKENRVRWRVYFFSQSITVKITSLCGNLICEYFCRMLGDPHFFFGRSLPFLILSIILKKKKKSVREKF